MIRLIFSLTLIPFLFSSAYAGLSLKIESGLVTASYNDVRIPNETGTLFSLTDDFKVSSKEFYRITIVYDWNDNNCIQLLYAPLTLNSSGYAPRDISFNGTSFSQSDFINAKYRFDSYRLTYRRTFYKNERFSVGLGLTGKIRDAAIELKSRTLKSEKTNTGFVPLINFKIDYLFSPIISARLEGDALVGPQGRAEDVFIGLNYSIDRRVTIFGGYRMLEGGADVDSVYNFAFLHYASVGMIIKLI
jgi:hypothetical protein